MASWAEFAAAAPELARVVRALFEARKHKVLGTLRKDGSPRLSGTETNFTEGEVWLGMMPNSLNALDLRRDPRVEVFMLSDDPPDEDQSSWAGDARIAGRAIEIEDPEKIVAINGLQHAGSHLFRIDVREVMLAKIGDPPDHMLIESWREGAGVRRVERR